MNFKAACIVSIGLILAACASEQQKAQQAFIAKDYKTAFADYLPLAQEGSPIAEIQVAYLYAEGLGVTQDKAQADRWYHQAALDGSNQMADKFGEDALYPPDGKPEYQQAIKWFQLAADRHDAGAALELSILYEHGLGVTKDEDTAVHWLDQYVAQTHVAGQKVQYKFSNGGDNTGGFISAIQHVMLRAHQHSPDANKYSIGTVYLSFHYQDGRATDVKLTKSSGDAYMDASVVQLMQETLLPPLLPSLRANPDFAMEFALGRGF